MHLASIPTATPKMYAHTICMYMYIHVTAYSLSIGTQLITTHTVHVGVLNHNLKEIGTKHDQRSWSIPQPILIGNVIVG